MRILSLFDGISCGKVALERAGILVDKYIAYEIDKSAIQISKKNHPDIIQRGDVTKADFTEYKGFDLVMGGSPCQGFSIAGKQLNFDDPRSKLFFEFWRAIKEVKPKYFLLENVKMKKEYQDIISEYRPGDNEDLTPYKVPFDKTLKIIEKEIQAGKVGYFRKDSQANRVYSIHGKAVTLCGEAGGGAWKFRAVHSIAEYLKEKLKGVENIAVLS